MTPLDPDETRAAQQLLADLDSLTDRNTPAMRRLRCACSKTWKRESPQFVLGVARQLSASGYRWIGCEMIREHPAAFAALNDDAAGGHPTAKQIQRDYIDAGSEGLQASLVRGRVVANEVIVDRLKKLRHAAKDATAQLLLGERGETSSRRD